ncbi:hypothetical protein L3X38_030287 [Prunus dulcis]|uniref:CCHC-type domain-containing protein n=1 Tax=Prunus dulcis TaxID=3755 RepID=A0AAD4YTV9_PRUDU|nr:hypothetical protein L3X38_030287 [Prunus dulcis]
MASEPGFGADSGAVSDEIFPRISHEESCQGAWNILKQEFHGDKQVRNVKLQSLRREFEHTRMREDESLSAYLTKLFDLINQMRGYGEKLSRERIAQKMLISLLLVYGPIYSVIEHSRGLDAIEVKEVVASLKSFAQRLERHHENKTEKAFACLSVDSKSAKVIGNQNSKHQKNWKDKGKKWDNKPADGAKNSCKHCGKLHFGECQFKGKPKCYNCDKFGHIAKDCYSKKPVQQQLQYATQVTLHQLCSVNNVADKRSMEDVWYLDSGCSNHMTGREDVLTDIDRSITAKVAMGTG